MTQLPIALESIRIDGFRSCQGTAFSPHPQLSVLIGPNGAGKTNILQGIALLTAWRDPAGAQPARLKGRAPGDAQVTAAFRVDGESLALRSTLRFQDSEDAPQAIAALKDEWRSGRLSAPNATGWVDIPVTFLLDARQAGRSVRRAPRGSPLDQPMTAELVQFYPAHAAAMEQVVAFRHRIRYYGASQFTDPAQCPAGLEINQDGALVGPATAGRAHRQFLFDLYQLTRAAPARYDAYLTLVGPTGLKLLSSLRWQTLSLSSRALESRTRGGARAARRERVLVVPTVIRDGDRLSFSQLSEGTLRALALVFYLMTDHSDLLLLEEPEVGVHRGLLVSLLELIRNQSRHQQIVISTHSDFVLDYVAPENVFAVKRTARGKTTVRGLTEGTSQKDMIALRDYLRTEGSLGEYWRTFGLES